MQRMHDKCVVMLSQDSFYRGLTPDELASVHTYNFDHPDAFDHQALRDCLQDLKDGRSVNVPIYDFTTHQRSSETRPVEPADVVILEGILTLHIEEIREMLNMKIYVDTDDDVRLARRIQRDVACRGRDVAGVIEQYTRFVKPAFDQFVAPSRRYADVIIPWQRGDNIVAIDLITEHIRTKLQQHHLRRVYPNLELIPSNYQSRGMHTIIRDRNATKNDFVFYADRLNRLVVEAGLGYLPFHEKTVTTPRGYQYVGVDFARRLCGVSIIRSGESMENALRACCKGIKIGKILVHRASVESKAAAAAAASAGSVRSLKGQRSPTPNGHLSPRSPLSESSDGSGTPPTDVIVVDPAACSFDTAPLRSALPPASCGQDASRANGTPQRSELVSGNGSAAPLERSPLGVAGTRAEGGVSPAPSAPGPERRSMGSVRTESPSPLPSLAPSPLPLGAVRVQSRAGSPRCGILPAEAGAMQDLIYEKLPADIAERHVLLMDPILSTGNTACRAIQVLMEKGVPENKILLLTVIAAPEGIHKVCAKYPAIKVITSEIDECVDDEFHVVPGVGEFGDRYFCD